MSGTALAPYTIGRNAQVVLLWQGTRIDLPNVTEFRSAAEYKRQRVDPLNSIPVEFSTPSGHRGTIMVDRKDATVEALFAAIEAAFWNAGQIGQGTLYAYITNTDGSISTFEYTGVSIELADAGSYQQEAVVRQSIAFFAAQKVQLS